MDAKCIDGTVAVQMLHPGPAKTFQDYADAVFLPYVSRHLETAERVDVIWDIYIRNSLKAITREKRGKRNSKTRVCDYSSPSKMG